VKTNLSLEKNKTSWALVAVIIATKEAEIRKIKVQSQPRQIVCKILS
jgi:hypothetical protein